MPFGGNDWLALTEEPTLEPELPICDPHHHFWDFRSERIPYQRYLIHELAADINSGHNVRSTAFIEARSMYRPDGPGAVALRWRGGVCPGVGRGQRQRTLRPRPGSGGHHRRGQPGPGRRSGAGAGRFAGGQSQPFPGGAGGRGQRPPPGNRQPGRAGASGRCRFPGRGAALVPPGGWCWI